MLNLHLGKATLSSLLLLLRSLQLLLDGLWCGRCKWMCDTGRLEASNMADAGQFSFHKEQPSTFPYLTVLESQGTSTMRCVIAQ